MKKERIKENVIKFMKDKDCEFCYSDKNNPFPVYDGRLMDFLIEYHISQIEEPTGDEQIKNLDNKL